MRGSDIQGLCDGRAWSRSQLVHELRRAGQRRGERLPADDSLKRMLRQWINGDRGLSQLYADLLGDVFGVPFEVQPTVADKPVGDGVDDVGLAYEGDAASAVASTVQLLDGDLGRLAALQPVPAAWSEASLRWLIRTDDDPLPARRDGQRVGVVDVAALRAVSSTFAQMDDQFGGDYGRRAVAEFIRSEVGPLLAGRYSEDTGRQLFSAAAEALHLLAWMSYDAGAHGVAQRYFVRALRMAQAGGDVAMAASTLDAMSHQANFLGQFEHAANLARAARTGSRGVATPTLTAHFYAMEARALASMGDVSSTDKALAAAARHFEGRRPDDDPEWIRYFDEGELAAELSHCYRDLGLGHKSMEAAAQAMTGSPRSDFFVSMVDAEARLMAGDVDGASAVAMAAVEEGARMKSARCVQYVRTFRARLDDVAGSPGASLSFAEQLADNPLWLAARVA